MNTRLEIIQSFIDMPPEDDFQRGYFYALVDEAVDDADEARSPTVIKAVETFRDNQIIYANFNRRRRMAAV